MLKRIDQTEVMQCLIDGKRVFHVTEITGETSINELMMCECLVIDEEDEEEPQEAVEEPQSDSEEEAEEEPTEDKKADVGRICALYKANWPVSKIAEEMKLSWPTVNYHLKRMGLK